MIAPKDNFNFLHRFKPLKGGKYLFSIGRQEDDFLAGKKRDKGVETAAPGDPHSFKCQEDVETADFLSGFHRQEGVNTQAPTNLE